MRKTADFHVDEPDRKIKTVLSDSSSRLPPRDLALILKILSEIFKNYYFTKFSRYTICMCLKILVTF